MSGSSLIREVGELRCAKCAEPRAAGARTPIFDAAWTLTRDGKAWRLCSSHASAASHHFGIVNRVFNPEGQVS